MWKPTNLMEALLPIFILDWIFCHGVIHYKSVKKLKINHSLLFSVITLMLHVLFFIIIIISKALTLQGSNMFEVTNITRRLIYTVIMIINIIVGWIFRNKAVKLITDILKVDKRLKSFGISMNTQREFQFSLKIAISWIFYSVLHYPVVTSYDFKNLEGLTKIVVIVVIIHGFSVNLLTDLKFFLLIKHMRLRFKNINKLLKSFLRSHTKNLAQGGTNDRWATSIGKNLRLDFLRNLRRIHLELGILCRNTTTVYGTPLTLTMIGLVVYTIGSLYCQYLASITRNSDIHMQITSVAITLFWSLPFVLSFFSINYICMETINERKKTGVILDILELESNDTEIQTEIRNFSAQIQRNSLKFSPCGFFDLNFYFVRDFAAGVTTYLVILLQTYPNNDIR